MFGLHAKTLERGGQVTGLIVGRMNRQGRYENWTYVTYKREDGQHKVTIYREEANQQLPPSMNLNDRVWVQETEIRFRHWRLFTIRGRLSHLNGITRPAY